MGPEIPGRREILETVRVLSHMFNVFPVKPCVGHTVKRRMNSPLCPPGDFDLTLCVQVCTEAYTLTHKRAHSALPRSCIFSAGTISVSVHSQPEELRPSKSTSPVPQATAPGTPKHSTEKLRGSVAGKGLCMEEGLGSSTTPATSGRASWRCFGLKRHWKMGGL